MATTTGTGLEPLKYRSKALAATNAHGFDTVPATPAFHFPQQSSEDSPPRRPYRVAQ